MGSECSGALIGLFASKLAQGECDQLWELAREEAFTDCAKSQPFTRLRTATISGTSTLLMYTRNGSVMLIRSSMF